MVIPAKLASTKCIAVFFLFVVCFTIYLFIYLSVFFSFL